MRFLCLEAIRINRKINKTNDIWVLCWIINDIGVYKGKIDGMDDPKLFNIYTDLTWKAMGKVRGLCVKY